MYLVINEDITKATVTKVLDKLLSKSKEDTTLTVYLNSQGGDVECGYTIYELLRLSGCEVTTYGLHEVWSSAIIIYLAGKHRYSTDFTSFMIHAPYHEIDETVSMDSDYYEKHLKELQEDAEVYFKLISERTQLTPNKIRAYIAKAHKGDWYLKPALAKKLGLVTKIGAALI